MRNNNKKAIISFFYFFFDFKNAEAINRAMFHQNYRKNE